MTPLEIGKFVYGMVNGTIEKWQQGDVDRLLTEYSLRQLYNMGRTDGRKPGEYILIWENEQAITKTILESAQDLHGRSDLVNRTVIIKFNGDAMRYILDNTDLITEIELPTKQKEKE